MFCKQRQPLTSLYSYDYPVKKFTSPCLLIKILCNELKFKCLFKFVTPFSARDNCRSNLK